MINRIWRNNSSDILLQMSMSYVAEISTEVSMLTMLAPALLCLIIQPQAHSLDR